MALGPALLFGSAVWIGAAPHLGGDTGTSQRPKTIEYSHLYYGVAGIGAEQGYPIPPADGATIDKDNQIILVRFEKKAYAFNVSYPRQNTALRWNVDEGQFQCPKHHSKYQPTGEFISGRATRYMDRLGIRLDGQHIMVDVAKFYRQDKNPAEWASAVVTLP